MSRAICVVSLHGQPLRFRPLPSNGILKIIMFEGIVATKMRADKMEIVVCPPVRGINQRAFSEWIISRKNEQTVVYRGSYRSVHFI